MVGEEEGVEVEREVIEEEEEEVEKEVEVEEEGLTMCSMLEAVG